VAGGRRIVIVGGGFGGAYCARRLAKRFRGTATEVRLIDRRNYLIFYPLLVEAGTGSLEPRHTVVSLREFVPDGRFMMAEVTDVDLAGGSVRCHIQQLDDHIDVAYDYLVLSPGSVTRLPDVSGLSEHAQTIKSLADAVALRDHAIAMLEVADAVSDPDQRRDALRFVVVGAILQASRLRASISRFCARRPSVTATSKRTMCRSSSWNWRIAFCRRCLMICPSMRFGK